MLHEYDVHDHYNTDKYAINNGDKIWKQCNIIFTILINYPYSWW